MLVGVLVPATNTVMERDCRAKLPRDVDICAGRMYLRSSDESSERVMIDEELPRASRDIACVKPDVVIFACTTAGAILGSVGESELIANLSRDIGAPAVSTNAAVLTELKRVGAERLGVVTAYADGLNASLAGRLEEEGLRVAEIAGMGLTDPYASGLVSADDIAEFAENSMHRRNFDTLFVSCTNLRAVEAFGRLRRNFGERVVTSNGAAIDETMRLLKRDSPA